MRAWRRFAVAAVPIGLAVGLTPTLSQAQNITDSEFKLGVWEHDVHFLGGKEHGVDINPEIIIASPIPDDWVANAPIWIKWTMQPRPTFGAAINTAGDTDQFYLGGTWTSFVTRNLVNPDDGIFFSIFFGPGFNNGEIQSRTDDRKSLGSNILFREALDVGYQFSQSWDVSAYIDHISNGGLAKENQSINDVGIRLGYHF